MDFKEQIKRFKGIIPIGPRDVSEQIEVLKTKVDIKELALNDLPCQLLKTAMYNATHCILNRNLNVLPEHMLFVAFQVIASKKSCLYLDVNNLNECLIYVIFEKHTGYIMSNNNQLFLDMELARGVSQYEYDTEGEEFRSLVSHLANACQDNIGL